MATKIGTINFTVDADTKGLQKALGVLKDFEKANNRVARSQSKAAKSEIAARARQEQAIRKALQKTLELRRAQQKAGAPPEQIARTTKAFQALTRQLTQGKISVLQFNRAVDQFDAKIGRGRRQLDNWTRKAREANKSTKKFAMALRDLESSAVLALGPLSGLGARIRSMGAIIGRGNALIAAFALTVATLIFTVVGASIQMVKFGEAFKSLELRFAAAAGTVTRGTALFEKTKDMALGLGLEINALAKGYSRFIAASQGTRLEGEKATKIFTQVAKASAALKLDATDLEGVMRAIEQIMSKGTVQAEELRGQLGDRLPGAFRIAAEAIGVSTRELNRMLKNGEVISDEFLPKFAQRLEEVFGKRAKANLQTASGQWTNLKTNIANLFATMDRATGLSAALARQLGIANIGLQNITASAEDAARAFDEMTESMLKVAKEDADFFTANFEGVSKIMKETIKTFDDASMATEALRQAGANLKDLDTSDTLKAVTAAAQLNEQEIRQLAFALGTELYNNSLAVKATIEDVTKALLELMRRGKDASDVFENQFKIPEVMEELARKIDEVRRRNEALAQGPDVQRVFDKVQGGIKQLDDALRELGFAEEQRKKMLEGLVVLLEEQDRLEQKNRETKKALTKDTRGLTRATEALRRAAAQINETMAQADAMTLGPDKVEEFNKVTRPLSRMAEELRKAGVEGEQARAVLKAYEIQLRRILHMTDRIAQANQQMADTIVRGFERVIVDGASVKGMLHELARELLRVAINALFLDKLRFSLFSLFNSGGAFPGIDRGVGGGITPAGGGLYATGGSFKLTGSGGSDKIPFYGVGRAGETVTVSTPSQGAGGGAGIVINQTNNFDGVQGARELIPILEENNRRLKADILKNMDRRTL